MIDLAKLNELARSVFQTEAEAEAWMQRPHPMLDGLTPGQAAGTPQGAARVHDILVAIKHGGAV